MLSRYVRRAETLVGKNPVSKNTWLVARIVASLPWGTAPSWQHASLTLHLALLRGYGPDQDTEDRLGDDICNRVPDLLASCRCDAGDSHHLDDVHEGVSPH